MKMSETIIELAKAMSKFQGQVKQPVKDGTNPHFKSNFVTLQGTIEAISKAASPNGLSFMQFPINDENKIGVYTMILHESGEWIESDPVFATPMKQDAQAVGAIVTYLKRYSLSAAFGIASELDTDGEEAMGRGNYQAPQQSYQKPQQTYNQSTPSSNVQAPALISDAQVKLIKTKLSIIGNRDTNEMTVIYAKALANLGFDATIKTNELNKSQASKMIEYLTSIQP